MGRFRECGFNRMGRPGKNKLDGFYRLWECDMDGIITADRFWLGIGFVGQTMMFMRFIIQWIATEKAKKVVVPLSFFYLSLIGGIILLAYAIHLGDPVFTIGLSINCLIHLRNIQLSHRNG